jgi:hypothetical protein
MRDDPVIPEGFLPAFAEVELHLVLGTFTGAGVKIVDIIFVCCLVEKEVLNDIYIIGCLPHIQDKVLACVELKQSRGRKKTAYVDSPRCERIH